LKKRIEILFELVKIKITSFVTVTTAFGYIAATGQINLQIIPVLFGVLLLAFGSAALNHYRKKNLMSKWIVLKADQSLQAESLLKKF
jgi:heme O synthase-like polyprenyltransferase